MSSEETRSGPQAVGSHPERRRPESVLTDGLHRTRPDLSPASLFSWVVVFSLVILGEFCDVFSESESCVSPFTCLCRAGLFGSSRGHLDEV